MKFLTRSAGPIFLGLALYFTAILPAPNEAAFAAEEGIEEIVVQAQRREANIQDIPLAVTALDQVMLDKRSIRNLNEIQYYVPNLISAGGDLNLRGIGRRASVGDASDPGFARHVNGVYLVRGSLVAGVHDLESIEVLRGPQGTLYGRNSIAGTLNIIYKKPVMNLETSGDVELGNYARQRFRFVVNTPVVKNKVALRVAGLVEKRNGYYEVSGTGESYEEQAPVVGLDSGNIDRLRVRSSLLYAAAKDISAILTWTYYHIRNRGTPAVLGDIRKEGDQIEPKPGEDPADVGIGSNAFQIVERNDSDTFARLRPSPSDLRKGNADFPSHSRNTQHFVTNTVEWKPSNMPFRVKSISGYQELDFWNRRDADRSNLDLLRYTGWDTGWAASTELEAASNDTKSPFQWVVGANYWHETTQRNGADVTIGIDLVDAIRAEPTLLTSFSREIAPRDILMGGNNRIISSTNPSNVYTALTSPNDAVKRDEFLTANGRENNEADIISFSQSLLGFTTLSDFGTIEKADLLLDLLDVDSNDFTYGQPDAKVGDGFDAQTTDVDAQFHSNIWAVFGEGSYEINRARLTAGLRYSVTEREFLQTNNHEIAHLFAGGTPCASSCSREWDSITWKVAADYDMPENFLPPLIDRQLIYGIISTGNRPGGFNFAPQRDFDEENLLAFELGAKHTLWNNRAEVNVGGFFYLFEDAQISETLDDIPVVRTIPDAEMFGIEIETRAEPIAGLQLNFNFGWQVSEVTSFFCQENSGVDASVVADDPACEPDGKPDTTTVNIDGNSLPNVAEFNISFGIEYERRVAQLEGSLSGRVNVVWRDDVNFYQFENPEDVQKAHQLVNVRVKYTHDSDRFGIEAYVDNVADEEIFTGLQFAGRDATLRGYSLNAPRTFGLRLFASY